MKTIKVPVHPKGMIKTPHQQRSRDTLHRILNGAEALLNERAWEDITVSDIVARADSSVGSFYARFTTKEDLVVALLERYHEEIPNYSVLTNDLPYWDSLTLADRAQRLIRGVISLCRRKRGLLRLRLQRRLTRVDPESTREPDRDRQNVDELIRLFASCSHEITRDDYQSALRFALRMVDGTAIAAIALGDISDSYGQVDDEGLIKELTAAFVGYLRT